jgi:hypothetical protein
MKMGLVVTITQAGLLGSKLVPGAAAAKTPGSSASNSIRCAADLVSA